MPPALPNCITKMPSASPDAKAPPGAFSLFRRAAQTRGAAGIAAALGLHPNTVKRWIDTGAVPRHYARDLVRILPDRKAGVVCAANGVKDKDQYFTRPQAARHCWQSFRQICARLGVDLRSYRFIEPAAGDGRFYHLLPKRRRIGVDIEPRTAEFIRADFLEWTPPPDAKNIVIGNPPFGLRGHLALQFINHAARFADMVAFILPQLFASDGKGVPGKRVREFALAHSENLPPDSFAYPDGRAVSINTLFQVWTKIGKDKIALSPRRRCDSFVKIYSLSDGGTPSSTRNKKMIGKCDVYLPSTCFAGMRAYKNFGELPNQRGYGVLIYRDKRQIKRLLFNHDWRKTAFYSTNAALNLRRSLIEDVVTSAGFADPRI